MVKLLILQADTVKKKMKLKSKFIFIICGDKVYYMDSEVGQMWRTDIETLENLGEGHKKVIRKAMK